MCAADLLENKNYAPKNFGDVCVLGLGKTGIVVANYFCELLGTRVNSVHVYAGEKKEFAMRTADNLLRAGASVSFDDKEIVHKYDLCVASPGISEFSPLVQTARENCKEVISEIELAWRESSKDEKWIAVTGTNGKTTTTSLITHIFNGAGRQSESVGNIGNVALDVVAKNQRKSKYDHKEFYIAEVSSYQLALCDKFAPEVAVLLNITPDHLSWHETFENYKNAKLKIFDNAQWAVVNCDDEEISKNLDKLPIKKIIKNVHDDQNIIITLQSEDHNIIPISEMKLLGEHNCVNARAAASAAILCGIEDSHIANGLKSFESLEHRLEPCGIVAGIRLYNDSKATNVDSVLVAMDAFEPKKAIFMLGGRDKNTNLDELVKKAHEKLKGVVCYGEACNRFYEEFDNVKADGDFLLFQAENMGSAFKTAMENAFPGDFVVLSPACSSFDEFNNFEERGRAFKSIVEKCKP